MTSLEMILGLAVLPASVVLVMALVRHEDRKLLRETSRGSKAGKPTVS